MKERTRNEWRGDITAVCLLRLAHFFTYIHHPSAVTTFQPCSGSTIVAEEEDPLDFS
jgi:hypothetical protein